MYPSFSASNTVTPDRLLTGEASHCKEPVEAEEAVSGATAAPTAKSADAIKKRRDDVVSLSLQELSSKDLDRFASIRRLSASSSKESDDSGFECAFRVVRLVLETLILPSWFLLGAGGRSIDERG